LVASAIAAVLATSAAAQPWNQPPERWNLADTYRVLQDSPWAPLKAGIKADLVWTQRHTSPVTRQPSELPDGPLEEVRAMKLRPKERPLPAVSVIWWSSRTVRLAQQRQKQLRGQLATGTPLEAAPLDTYVILVEGTEPLRILKDAEGDLLTSVYLELSSGMTLDVARVEFHEGERAGEDYVAFYFPREIEGQPTISPVAASVTFVCKATAKTELSGRPNTLTVRAQFEPHKMQAHNQPDL